jgi:hypothetical protein
MHRLTVAALATLLFLVAALPAGAAARSIEDVRRRTDMRVTQAQREAAAERMRAARAAVATKAPAAKAQRAGAPARKAARSAPQRANGVTPPSAPAPATDLEETK